MAETRLEDLIAYAESVKNGFVFEPLPSDLCWTSDAPLASVPDEVLLNASPALLSHIIRTAANGGMQVLGPENIPSTTMLNRVMPQHRQADLVTVGSVANVASEWPTFDGVPVPRHLIPEPFVSVTEEPSIRVPVVTAPVARAEDYDDNPVVQALMKAIGVVGLQNAPGVMGDSAALAELLEKAWGLEPGRLEELQNKVQVPTDDLLRYVIRSDRTRPLAIMPVHARQTVSVHMGPTTRKDYGVNRSFDWQRARAVAEATWYMSVRLEGKSVGEMWSGAPPGDLSAPITRDGLLVFQPAPMSVFSYPMESLRADINIRPKALRMVGKKSAIVNAAVSFYEEVLTANPRDDQIARSRKMVVSRVVNISRPEGNTVVSANIDTIKAMTSDLSRGKTAAAVSRSAIYDCLRTSIMPGGSSAVTAAMEFMHAVSEMEVAEAGLVHKFEIATMLSRKLMPVGIHLRNSLAAEAGRQRSSLAEWFEMTCHSLPVELRPKHETTSYWVLLAAYDIIAGSNPKWVAMNKAARINMIKSMVAESIRDVGIDMSMPRPAAMRRVVCSVVESAAAAWSVYYKGTKDAAYTMSTLTDKNARAIKKLYLTASLLWELRARIVATCKTVVLFSEARDSKSYRSSDTGTQFILAIDSTRAVSAYNGSIQRMGCYTTVEKKKLMLSEKAMFVSSTRSWLGDKPLLPVSSQKMAQSRIMRYVMNPQRLWDDIQAFMDSIAGDIRMKLSAVLPASAPKIVLPIADFPREAIFVDDKPIITASIDAQETQYNGYYWSSAIGHEGLDLVDMLMMDAGDDIHDEVMMAEYDNEEEFRQAVYDALDAVEAGETIFQTANTLV